MLSLKINNAVIQHFTNCRITRSIDTISDGFSLTLHESFEILGDPGNFLEQPVEILIHNETVLKGIIEQVSCNEALELSGRELTGDLIDCEIETKNQFNNITLSELIRALIKPYGIKLRSESAELFKSFRIESNETAFKAIKRACSMKGVHVYSDGLGHLKLGNPGKKKSGELSDGNNLLTKSVSLDNSRRFHSYTVMGKSVVTGSGWDKKKTRIKGTATDAGIRKSRKKIIQASGDMNQSQADKLAAWEAASRRAKALKVSASVQGWKTSDKLWTPGETSRVKIPDYAIDQDLLIKSVSFEFGSDSGSVTSLELIPADALTPKPVISKKEKKKTKGWNIL